MLEDISGKLRGMDCIRMLSQTDGSEFVKVCSLEAGEVEEDKVFQTVSPAIAFQYMTDTTQDMRLVKAGHPTITRPIKM